GAPLSESSADSVKARNRRMPSEMRKRIREVLSKVDQRHRENRLPRLSLSCENCPRLDKSQLPEPRSRLHFDRRLRSGGASSGSSPKRGVHTISDRSNSGGANGGRLQRTVPVGSTAAF